MVHVLLRLFLLFTLIPLLELYLLIRVGAHIGALATIAIVIATGAAGGLLARSQGLATLERVRLEFLQGRLPAESLFDGLLILLAAVVLITPGLLTDCLGLALLVPWTRNRIRRRLADLLRGRLERNRNGRDGGWGKVE